MSTNAIETDWMLMLYLSGDNNLSEDMAGTLDQIRSMKKGPQNVAVLAYYDSGYPQIETRYYDFTPKLSGAVRDFSEKEHSEKIKETNTADPKSIVEFVRHCKKKYKAKHHALFLSGHSDGFQGMSLFRDEQSKSVMSLSGLRGGLKKAKELIGKNFEILGFDGCVMGSIEIAYEFREIADIMISSQGFIPNAGLNYAEMLEKENWDKAGFTKTPEELAVQAMEVYLKRQQGFAIGGRSVTVSACRLGYSQNETDEAPKTRPIVQLEKRINELSKILYDNLAFNEVFNFASELSKEEFLGSLIEKLLARERLKKALLSSQWESQTLLFEQAVDVKDFCRRLIYECRKAKLDLEFTLAKLTPAETKQSSRSTQQFDKIVTKCEEIITEFNKCIIEANEVKSVGAEYQFAQGLSLFFPWSHMGYGISKSEYDKTEFCKIGKKKQWNEFLDMYLRQVTMRGGNDILWEPILELWEHISRMPEDKAREAYINLDLDMFIGLIKELKDLENKYNPTYATKGIENDIYLRFFSKFKNLPQLIDGKKTI